MSSRNCTCEIIMRHGLLDWVQWGQFYHQCTQSSLIDRSLSRIKTSPSRFMQSSKFISPREARGFRELFGELPEAMHSLVAETRWSAGNL